MLARGDRAVDAGERTGDPGFRTGDSGVRTGDSGVAGSAAADPNTETSTDG
jgi:hypothetical protein